MIYLPCFSTLDNSGNFNVPQGKLREFVSAKFVGNLVRKLVTRLLLGSHAHTRACMRGCIFVFVFVCGCVRSSMFYSSGTIGMKQNTLSN